MRLNERWNARRHRTPAAMAAGLCRARGDLVGCLRLGRWTGEANGSVVLLLPGKLDAAGVVAGLGPRFGT
jgi:hypothetical protein